MLHSSARIVPAGLPGGKSIYGTHTARTVCRPAPLGGSPCPPYDALECAALAESAHGLSAGGGGASCVCRSSRVADRGARAPSLRGLPPRCVLDPTPPGRRWM